jgi:predicted TIM-barrel fold metal-dependent hydrolase
MMAETSASQQESGHIDVPQHFWTHTRTDCPFLTPDAGALCDDFLPERLHPERERHGLVGTVAVPAIAAVAESLWALDLARTEPASWGVGWVDLAVPGEIFAHPLGRPPSPGSPGGSPSQAAGSTRR